MIKKIAAFATLIIFSFHANAQTTAERRCVALGKGMNISNWLEASWQSNWPTANGYSKADLILMKEAGIQSLRLPICFAEITDSIAPYYVDTNHLLFTRIDSVIKWADELQMNLIIDNHHEWSFMNQRWRVNRERFAHLWGVVANRYKYLNPDRFTFELLNEPSLYFELDSLNIILNDAIDSIRKYTTAHTIIVTPNGASLAIAYSNTYQPLADTNLMYTWHCYDPVDFTHQGFSWSNPLFPTGTPFPTLPVSFFEQILYNGIANLNQWRNTYHKPLFLGEFGVSENADEDSRCRWMQYMSHYIDSTDMPWFYWDWRWDFSMFNSHVISADSIIPCFSQALRLYGDSTFSSVNSEINAVVQDVKFFPTVITSGASCFFQVKGVGRFSCRIFDSAGRLVLQHIFNQPEGKLPIDLDRGIYFVQIEADDNIAVRKLICN